MSCSRQTSSQQALQNADMLGAQLGPAEQAVPFTHRDGSQGAQVVRVDRYLFSDNEYFFFLMADYSAGVVDIREQFPLFPETAAQEIASSLGVRHPRFPRSTTPIVMTTDFLLTLLDESGKRSFWAISIKSADELRRAGRKSVLVKLEIERRYWLQRGVPWSLFTCEEFDETFIANLDWLSYFMVERDVDHGAFLTSLPIFLEAFNSPFLRGLPLAHHLRACADVLGHAASAELVTDMFRYCVWYRRINLDLRMPIGLRRVPALLPAPGSSLNLDQRGDSNGSSLSR
jgi:hypothetical protein